MKSPSSVATSLAVPIAAATMLSVASAASSSHGPIPSTGMDWMSLPSGLQFQPTAETAHSPALSSYAHRMLAGSTSGYENEFIDGSETYYNDYAQAWRLIGFYTDCNAPHNNFNECNDGDDNNDEEDNDPACQRYLLWAAYIDPNYSGGGIGEYQFYDRHEMTWDSTSCVAESGRCAKMDCHLQNSNFQLLGFFKEPNYHEWMEQLFKHQGVCLWNNDEYNFMQTERYIWPCYCTSTDQTDEKGNTLYYDTKPMPEGRIGLGLYTDARCMYDYTGNMNIEDVLENVSGDNEYGSAYDLATSLATWNDAFDVYKVCQPCKAYNLGYNQDLNDGSGDREGGDDDGGVFSCYDDADYTNVNQCMKFKTKTEMLAADFRDIMLAHEQGNIVEFELAGKTYGYGGFRRNGVLETSFSMTGSASTMSPRTIGFFCGSVFFLLGSVLVYLLTRARVRTSKSMKEPLLDTVGSMGSSAAGSASLASTVSGA